MVEIPGSMGRDIQVKDQACSGRFDGEGITVGWTDVCDRPYPETVGALRDIGRDMYEFRRNTGTNQR